MILTLRFLAGCLRIAICAGSLLCLIFLAPRPLLFLFSGIFCVFFKTQKITRHTKNQRGENMRKLLLGLIGLLFAVPAVATDLPAGYTELEYIESERGAYIDTGISYGKFVHDIQFTIDGQRNLLGCGVSDSQFWEATAADRFIFSSSSNGYILGNPANRNIVEFSINKTEASLTVGNDTRTHTHSNTSNRTYLLFALNGSTTYSALAKLYSLKVYNDSDVLIQDLVPVKRLSDGEVGLYDTVSGQFFTNQGTGTFTAGPVAGIHIATTAYNSARFSPVVTELNDTIATIRSVVTNTINQTKAIADLQAIKQTRPNENCPAGKKCLLVEDDAGQPHWYEIIENAYGLPSGYTGLEYVDMQSESYLQTDIVPTYDGRVEMDFQTTTFPAVGGAFMGGRSAGYPAGLILGFNVNKTFVFDGFSENRYQSTNLLTNNTRYKYTWNNQVAKLETGGSVVGTNTFTGENANGSALAINALNNNGSIIGNEAGIYLYSFKVWNALGELVMDLIPAKNSSGVVGMYDTVSETFKTATAGTFAAGPEI